MRFGGGGGGIKAFSDWRFTKACEEGEESIVHWSSLKSMIRDMRLPYSQMPHLTGIMNRIKHGTVEIGGGLEAQ